MANYQNFAPNNTNNVENTQFSQEAAQGNVLMLNSLLQSFDQNNKVQPNTNINNNNNNLLYAIQPNGFNLTQQMNNHFQPQYINGLQGMNLLQMGTNGQPIGVYFNNNNQLFPSADGYNNMMQQFVPMSNMNQGMMQVDINQLNKNMAHRDIQMRVPKKVYNEDRKPLENGEIEYDHKNRPLIYCCKECPRRFSMNSRLLTHMRCHNGERPHVCLECNFAFTQKSYLVRHAAVHKEERPYQCLACKKTYKHYGSLANHRKTHKNGHKDIHNNGMVESKIEPECVIDENATFQGQQYLFNNHELKEEPQHTFMPTDLSSSHIFPSTDHSSNIYTSSDHSNVFQSSDHSNIFPSSDHSNVFPSTDHSTNMFTSNDQTSALFASTDPSSNVFTSTDDRQSFMEQLFPSQNQVFYTNENQQEVPATSQPSDTVTTSTFPV